MSAVGVLALQGDFSAHAAALGRIGAQAREVRHTGEIAGLSGLIIPGGESTTLLNLMADEPWFDALRELHARGAAILGTCAGAILLCREVLPRAQPSLGLIDASIERNAYGRQVESFETLLGSSFPGGPVPAVFIRAPRFRRVGPGVEVILEREGEPVGIRQGRAVALTFHPELTEDERIHRYFVELMGGGQEVAGPGRVAVTAP